MATVAKKVGGRRDQIVDIAMDLFAKSGSQAVSVREIAENAGILSGSLYTHFRSKTDILDSGIRPYVETVLEDLQEITARDLPPRVIIQLLVRRNFERIVTWQSAASIMYSEWSYLVVVDGFDFLPAFGREVQAVWLKVLREAIADGSLAEDVDPEILFRLLREVMAGVARRYRPGGRYSSAAISDYLYRMIFNGLDGGVPDELALEPDPV